ncbi:MAG: exosortase system-associated protein, TIGR04073 family [Verrucomicrobia bacterium]|nr:exosortase system-associated protein, TIGR04073 family [Verrucomicrobiota bacterium]
MKKVLAVLLAAGLGTMAVADIQSPPGNKYTPARKLSRALANIFYGPLEVTATFQRTLDEEGNVAAWSHGIVNGLDRAGSRIGYGLYELVNFRTPMYKESYRAPYASDTFDSVHGYTEYPVSAGFTSANYVRRQSF